jgi:Holliday junction DNA helicase RuvA
MIGALQGQVVRQQPPHVLVQVGGFILEVLLPASGFSSLHEPGAPCLIHTHLLWREDGPVLYGFLHEEERTLFRRLLRINGVGPKTALAMVSSMPGPTLQEVIAQENVAALAKIPGIGQRTAARVILELRHVFAAHGAATEQVATSEALDALCALGYSTKEATALLKAVGGLERATEVVVLEALQHAGRGKVKP